MSDTLKTISQERAAYALKCVREQTEGGNKLQGKARGELRARANQLPALIHQNGLGQAVAFYKAKNSTAHIAMYKILQKWLCDKGQPYAEYKDLLTAITKSDAATYRAAQAEAQALLIWVKQFVRAFVTEDEELGADNE